MVTQWDGKGEQLITSMLAQLRPNDGLLGEEGSQSTGTTGINWVVDPIDGTTNFLYGIPIYAVSIAACDVHGPIAGAVYIPPNRELFVAERGRGAWLQGQRLKCNDDEKVDHALVATGFSYSSTARNTQINRLTSIVPQVRDLRRIGSAATDLCYLAAGRLDVYFEEHLHSWDYMAGMLIATEAGAICTNFSGGPVDGGEILASGPRRHQRFISFLDPRLQS
jgi:myo-inositol-1(or 4)-monophosphatase